MNIPLYDHLLDEHRALLAHYGRTQTRCTDLLLAQARESERMQAEIVRLRARAIMRDSALIWEREDRAAAISRLPGLPRRRVLAQQVEVLVSRIHALAREVLHWQWRASVGALNAAQTKAIACAGHVTEPPGVPIQACGVDAVLGQHPARSVLCIGQDASGALVTQRMVESAQGLFAAQNAADALLLAADGTDAALEASLVAADLVICQTGCVGHNAYWRVQDHCRRTGKPCVLVDQPQVMHFMRGAQAAREEAAAHTA